MAEAGARGLDVFDPSPPRSVRMAAAEVLRGVGEPDGTWRLPRRRAGMPPVVRVADRFLTGTLDLRAVEFPYLLEFVRCRFEEPPDLRQGKLAGIAFADCWLPGVSARNLSSANEVSLDGSTVEGLVDLVDADVAGSLSVRDSALSVPDGIALHADRLKVAGGLLAQRVRVTGELRMAGAHVGGYCNFSGGLLTNPRGHAINGTGLHVGGNLLMNGCTLRGTVLLAGARVDSALTLRGASAADGRSDDDALDPHSDPNATLVFDRIAVDGDVQLDRGFTSAGTVRMVNAALGGTLSLSGGTFDALGAEDGEPTGYGRALATDTAEPTGYGRALHLDGTTVGGDIIGRQRPCAGRCGWSTSRPRAASSSTGPPWTTRARTPCWATGPASAATSPPARLRWRAGWSCAACRSARTSTCAAAGSPSRAGTGTSRRASRRWTSAARSSGAT
ncbi:MULTISPECIES: hypothetical protein [Saccharothrix]|uniref:hypothetical protein n=1 Tax=Saccharothrix TaxID=2071 RepID=UPI0009683D5A|nr:hypothetical protein [Saccharothrix sp. CB00851]OKI39310.1 hypothetical protein A6A25_03930 [Saccharothrix sp. CB00851]